MKFVWIRYENGGVAEQGGGVDQGAASEDPEGVVGTAAVEDEVAVERRRPRAAEEAPAGVRAPPQAAPPPLPLPQSRLRLRLAGHPLLHGPLRMRLQGSLLFFFCYPLLNEEHVKLSIHCLSIFLE